MFLAACSRWGLRNHLIVFDHFSLGQSQRICGDHPFRLKRISRPTYEAMKLRYLCILDFFFFCFFRVIIWGFLSFS
jgi:hypothetical protein